MAIRDGAMSHLPAPEAADEAGGAATDTQTLAVYVGELILGVRQLIAKEEHRDLNFLDYLLAMAGSEAETLSRHVYH